LKISLDIRVFERRTGLGLKKPVKTARTGLQKRLTGSIEPRPMASFFRFSAALERITSGMVYNTHPAGETGPSFGTKTVETEFSALNLRDAQCSLSKLGLGSEYGFSGPGRTLRLSGIWSASLFAKTLAGDVSPNKCPL
jgi:hypothetical protein